MGDGRRWFPWIVWKNHLKNRCDCVVSCLSNFWNPTNSINISTMNRGKFQNEIEALNAQLWIEGAKVIGRASYNRTPQGLHTPTTVSVCMSVYIIASVLLCILLCECHCQKQWLCQFLYVLVCVCVWVCVALRLCYSLICICTRVRARGGLDNNSTSAPLISLLALQLSTISSTTITTTLSCIHVSPPPPRSVWESVWVHRQVWVSVRVPGWVRGNVSVLGGSAVRGCLLKCEWVWVPDQVWRSAWVHGWGWERVWVQ